MVSILNVIFLWFHAKWNKHELGNITFTHNNGATRKYYFCSCGLGIDDLPTDVAAHLATYVYGMELRDHRENQED